MLITSSSQLIEQRLCLYKVGRVEALGEPAVDGREQLAGFGTPAPVAAEPGEAHGGAQFPELGPLWCGTRTASPSNCNSSVTFL
jgi:hypothetical protein